MSQASKPQAKTSVSCNCKQVQIEFTGTDKGAVLCHCSNCQKSSGSAFAHNHRFISSEINIIKGKELVKLYADNDTKSGNTLNRHFCSNCGSPLYLENPTVQGLVVFHHGTVDGETTQPKFDLFPENKHSWVGQLTTSKGKL